MFSFLWKWKIIFGRTEQGKTRPGGMAEDVGSVVAMVTVVVGGTICCSAGIAVGQQQRQRRGGSAGRCPTTPTTSIQDRDVGVQVDI